MFLHYIGDLKKLMPKKTLEETIDSLWTCKKCGDYKPEYFGDLCFECLNKIEETKVWGFCNKCGEYCGIIEGLCYLCSNEIICCIQCEEYRLNYSNNFCESCYFNNSNNNNNNSTLVIPIQKKNVTNKKRKKIIFKNRYF